ncbi:MAG: hypothetical protein JO179_12770 [Solirubrobacterales bacterium]|nr:hypothetical protein [Solirubrobacterales bacterium]
MPVRRTREQRAAIAGMQRGRVGRRQLLGDGLPRGAIARRPATSQLQPSTRACTHSGTLLQSGWPASRQRS